MNEIKRLSVDERAALGRAARERALPSSHAGWSPAHDRPDPVGLLELQDATLSYITAGVGVVIGF